ncbi:MAG: invasion associated locus B family protein [Proteobacteria bacterium]|nr:invasion associated locus B family protein [Pseudomonadota bacterium]
MFVKSIATTLAILVASASIASAQSPTRIQQFKAWGAYSYKAQNGTLCYVLAVPTDKQPANVDHGDVFFIVSQRPGQNISYEPQVMVGYPMKADAKVVVTIDNKNFNLFVKEKSAWVENAAEEPALIAAMKSGKSLKVQATSARGTKTNYTYSLDGISAALQQIQKCK